MRAILRQHKQTGVNDMECAVRLAEINNDTQTDAQEQALYTLNIERHKIYTQMLLDGLTIEENGRKYSLAERMADEYQEFSDKVDNGDDFMGEYLAGGFGDRIRNIFKQEAQTLASIICGV